MDIPYYYYIVAMFYEPYTNSLHPSGHMPLSVTTDLFHSYYSYYIIYCSNHESLSPVLPYFYILLIVVDCGSLRSPVNGDVDFVRTTFGAMAFYSCDTGFFLQGFATRICQANGLWSNSEPTCERKSIDIIPLHTGPHHELSFQLFSLH